MNVQKLKKNIADQIKEAQMKLGYMDETVRLYYPVESLCALIEEPLLGDEEMEQKLQTEVPDEDEILGRLHFQIRRGRVEVSISPQGVKNVYEKLETPAFLADIITLFQEHHHCSIEDVQGVFERYSKDYVCEQMPEGSDFDYALHFIDESIDEYYYCIKMEMGHTIYHRFTKIDYEMLLVS